MLVVRYLGVVDYDVAWALQKRVAADRISGTIAHDTLLVVQHPPVITMGRSTKPDSLRSTPEQLSASGIKLREVERGGDVTIHEPGQLVAYPIIDLQQHRKDLHWYLRQLEEATICSLTSCGLDSGRQAGQTGVWREGRKLASIGVHVRNWVTWHGVALNVDNNLRTFDHVVPCGIDDVVMTTVARECTDTGLPAPAFDEVARAFAACLAQLFNLTITNEGEASVASPSLATY